MALSTIASYNLTFIAPPQPVQLPDSSEGSLDIAAIMPQPFRIYEVPGGNELANLQQRLTVSLTPPKIVVADHSGLSQPQAQMITAAKALVDTMALTQTQVESYGWNADLLIDASGSARVLEELFNEVRIENLLSKERTNPWSADRIEMSAPAEFADKVNLILLPLEQSEASHVRVVFNAHFDSPPVSSDLDRQAHDFGELSQDLVDTLSRAYEE